MTRFKPMAVVALIAGATLVACGGPSSSTSPTENPTLTTLAITAQNLTFTPATLAAGAGEKVTVTLTNHDTVEHSFTPDRGLSEIEAEGGATKSATITLPPGGLVQFHCKYHPQMKGTIAVGTGAKGAGDGSAAATSAAGSGTRLHLRLRINRVGRRAPSLVAALAGLMDEATVRPMFAGLAERVR